jgi:hypothetical protein
MTDDKRGRGRPLATIPEATCERLAEWLASGRTVASFARAEGVSVRIVNRWLERREELREARIVGHDTLAAECLTIADGATAETVAADRLRIDTRRWLLSRWSPERYGDAKASGESGATVVVVTGVPREQLVDAVERNTVERNGETTPTPGRSPLAASRTGGEEHNISDTQIPPSTPQPRLTVEIDPPVADDPL